jgi:hypothetical protein
MNHLFGKKKEPAPKPGVTEAATKMKAHLATMEKREKFIEQKIAKEVANAKERSRAKDKRGALMALKRKKMHEGVRAFACSQTARVRANLLLGRTGNQPAATGEIRDRAADYGAGAGERFKRDRCSHENWKGCPQASTGRPRHRRCKCCNLPHMPWQLACHGAGG